jgi:hypothetical protein
LHAPGNGERSLMRHTSQLQALGNSGNSKCRNGYSTQKFWKNITSGRRIGITGSKRN